VQHLEERMADTNWTPERIKELRQNRGMTQKQFAEHLKVHVVTIIRWEKGAFEPHWTLAEKLDALERGQATVD
jgi:DNA-binding XRE family transcriptional regulator